ncbi:MAG: universal stress protein [Bacilli bacterium]
MLEYKNVLVAVDGSESAGVAFAKAIQIVQRYEAELHIVHVIEMNEVMLLSGTQDQVLEIQRENGANIIKKYKELAVENSCSKVKTYLEIGRPKVVIADELRKEIGADLIVCGARGMNIVERFLIGSVSEYIAKHAKCDVLVVKR